MLKGEAALSVPELLAIILRTGNRNVTAVNLAHNIMSRFKSLGVMSTASMKDWLSIPGLGHAKVCQVRAALELGRRFRAEEAVLNKMVISDSESAFDVLAPRLKYLGKEHFCVIFLSASNEVIIIEDLAKGTVDQANPIIREIYHRAIEVNAVSFICAHNHPSGQCQPSNEDKVFTRDLRKAGDVMGISMLDHIIIGNDGFFSFRDEFLLL